MQRVAPFHTLDKACLTFGLAMRPLLLTMGSKGSRALRRNDIFRPSQTCFHCPLYAAHSCPSSAISVRNFDNTVRRKHFEQDFSVHPLRLG
ncbi:hypothetical protein DID99_35070 [Burkholderia sp. Bp8986]|nr:hypothetical protein DID99_35070 [Burkholderia sp. Bp8986]